MYQEIELIGNVGKNGVELRYTPDGKPVANFSLAINEKHGDKKITGWFNVSFWNRSAEVCNEYLKEGNLVFVKGHLRFDETTGGPRQYKRTDGTQGSKFEVNGTLVKFLTPKGEQIVLSGDAPGDEYPF